MDPILKDEIVDHLPVDIEGITQYFGSMVVFHLRGQGNWNARLRLNLCDWVLTQCGIVTANSGSFGNMNNRILEPLKGDQLVSFEWRNKHSFEIMLSSGACFSLKENLDNYEPNDELFNLWVNEDYGVAYSPELGFQTGLK